MITADAAPAREAYPVRWVPRSLPPGVRHVAGRAARRRARARAPTSSTRPGCSAARRSASRLARTPLVVKLTADPAFERARRWGLWRGSLEEFQARAPRDARAPLRLARDADVRRAAHVVTPSAYLRELALGWGVPPDRVTVLPNPAPPLPELRPRDELRRRARLRRADARVRRPADGAEVARRRDRGGAPRRASRSLIAGDGPDRAALERLGHARFLGPLPRERRARALPRGRRVAALVVVGELPAHGRRGARGRDAGDRDAGRRRRRGRARRRERARWSSRATSPRWRSRSTASSPTPSSPRGCARTRRRRSPTTRPSASTAGSRRSCSAARRA